MDVTEKIIEFASIKIPPPEKVLKMVQISLLDWSAVTRAGQNEPVVKKIRDFISDEGSGEQSYAVGLKQLVSARGAATINGVASHALDYDDTHFASLGHPSSTVFASVLALADKIQADMESIQVSSLIGLEISIRLGVWLGREHYRKGFHVTGTAGTFGAAVACSHLLALNKKQIRMAIGIAASRAAGIKAQFGTMAKPLHIGQAASAGIEAALLASKDFIATDEGLSGQQGFSVTHHGEENLLAFANLGEKYFFENVSHKFHACCHGLHAMLEALEEIKKNRKIQIENLEKLEVTVHPQYLKICNISKPSTALEAKFSFGFCAALCLLGKDTSDLTTFSTEACSVKENIFLSSKVIVLTDETFSETKARVCLYLKTGLIIKAEHDLLKFDDIGQRQFRVQKKASKIIGEETMKNIWTLISNKPYSAGNITQSLLG